MFCVQVVPMETLNNTLLITLLDFAQNDIHASVARLAKELSVTRAQVAIGLNQLAEDGLVRPDTVRLTFVGLMKAAGLRSRIHRSGSVAA